MICFLTFWSSCCSLCELLGSRDLGYSSYVRDLGYSPYVTSAWDIIGAPLVWNEGKKEGGRVGKEGGKKWPLIMQCIGPMFEFLHTQLSSVLQTGEWGQGHCWLFEKKGPRRLEKRKVMNCCAFSATWWKKGLTVPFLKGGREDSFKEDLFTRHLKGISTGKIACIYKNEQEYPLSI